MTKDDIKQKMKVMAGARDDLEASLSEYDKELVALQKKYSGEVRLFKSEYLKAKRKVERAVKANAPLFVKPRSITLDGIKVGWKKLTGKTVIKNSDKTLARIESILPDQLDTLAPMTRTISKDALGNLKGDML